MNVFDVMSSTRFSLRHMSSLVPLYWKYCSSEVTGTPTTYIIKCGNAVMTNLLFVYPRKVTLRETSPLMCIEKAKRDKREVKVAAKKQLCLVLHFILSLFSDPRKWSQEEVRQWLIWTSARHSLPIDPARFPMNGKSLCLMSLAMFSYRLPLGGKLLYKDFQLRLTAAFHIEDNLDRHHQKIIKIIHH